MKHNFAAEQFKDKYPCTFEQWFYQNKLSRYNFETMKEIIKSNNFKSTKIKVLDWGCGNLMWSIGLFPKAEITGVEISKEVLGFAKINAQRNNVKFHPVYIDSINSLKDESFDIVISYSVIEFLNDQQFEEIFTNIFNKLKLNGKLICTFHNWRKFSALYISYLFKRNAYNKYCNKLGYKISKKSLKQVKNDFLKMGYKILEAGAFNPYPIRFREVIKNKVFYKTRNIMLAHWYCTQYIVVEKIINKKI